MLYSAVFGVLVLGDDAFLHTLIGGQLIIASAVLIAYNKSSAKRIHLLKYKTKWKNNNHFINFNRNTIQVSLCAHID